MLGHISLPALIISISLVYLGLSLYIWIEFGERCPAVIEFILKAITFPGLLAWLIIILVLWLLIAAVEGIVNIIRKISSSK